MLNTFDLWLPLLLSAVGVFIASSILHMVVPIHRGDHKKLPDETDKIASLRGVATGSYMFPCPNSMKDMGSPEMQEKYKNGPVGFLVLFPSGPPAMGKSLFQWFVYCLLVGLFVAYLGSLALHRGAAGDTVFRFAATVAFLGYGTSAITNSIWKGQEWSTALKFAFDGLIYAVVTGAVFCWMWPGAMV